VVLTTALIVPAGASAVEIAFDRLFFGHPWRSVVDDTTAYGSSYVRAEWHYWDLYHERRDESLHDYQQNAALLSAVFRRGVWLLGAEAAREHLSLRQENVYTDNDHLDGSRERAAAVGMVGLFLERGGYPLGVERLDLVGAAGSNGEFIGFVEAGVMFGDWLALLFKGETFETRLETEESVSGYSFPFHFPYRTGRSWLRADILPQGWLHTRAWGCYQRSSGDGHAVKGLENRVYYEAAAAGLSFDHGLQLHHRLQITPRLRKEGSSFPAFRVTGAYRTGRGDLGMRFNGTRYLLLDGLETRNAVVRVDVVPHGWLAPFIGWERLGVTHDGQSFFDIWPFVIWDVFMSKRYRIGEIDGHLDSWFAGLGGMVEWSRSTFEWSGRFEWWQNEADLVWFERIDVLFPFFFDYERHDESLDLKPKYAVQLDAVLDLDLARWARFRLTGNATVPFGDSSADGPGPAPPDGGAQPPPPQEDKDTTHGGLAGTVEWIISL
jgi:hypothetical protein